MIKILELQFQYQSFQWVFSELISCKTDWFDLAVQGTLRGLLQHHSLNASVLRCSTFFTCQDRKSNHVLCRTRFPNVSLCGLRRRQTVRLSLVNYDLAPSYPLLLCKQEKPSPLLEGHLAVQQRPACENKAVSLCWKPGFHGLSVPLVGWGTSKKPVSRQGICNVSGKEGKWAGEQLQVRGWLWKGWQRGSGPGMSFPDGSSGEPIQPRASVSLACVGKTEKRPVWLEHTEEESG